MARALEFVYGKTRIGGTSLSGPVSAPTAVQGAGAGAITAGTHVFAYSFIDSSGVESVPSPVTGNVTFDGAHLANLSSVAVGGAGVVDRGLYMSAAGTTSPLYLIGTVGDNTTTSITGTGAADAVLKVNQVAVTSGFNNPVDVYRIKHGYPKSTFSCEFLVKGADQPTFAAACQSVEAALRTPRQRLTVKISGNTILDLNPATAVNSGFNAMPEVERVSEAVENWGLLRRYKFTVVFDRPGDLTGQQGRREETVTVHTDLLKRRVVTFTGTWTAMPGNDARANYSANSGTHYATILTQIDVTASWVKVSDDVPDDDTDKTIAPYRAVFWEVVNGRRESDILVEHTPSNVATVTITGVYVQTLGPLTSARSNYTTNEPAHATAVIAALGISAYELVKETSKDNEQDQTLSFTRVYRELIHAQSPGLNDDPTIILDTIELETLRYPINDSSAPTRTAGTSTVNNPPPVGTGGTQDRGSSGPSSQDGGSSSGGSTVVRKLVDLKVRYTAWIDRSVTDLKIKWDNVLRGYMYSLMSTRLKLSAALVTSEQVTLDVPNNRIVCNLLCNGVEGSIFSLDVNVAKDEQPGIVATPVLGAKPNTWLLQQGAVRITFVKQVRVVFKTGAFDVTSLYSVPPSSNLVLMHRSRPVFRTKDFGIVGLGLSTLGMTEVQFNEEYLQVDNQADRGGAAGGAANGGGGATPNGANSTGNLFQGNAGFGLGSQGGSQSSAFQGQLGG